MKENVKVFVTGEKPEICSFHDSSAEIEVENGKIIRIIFYPYVGNPLIYRAKDYIGFLYYKSKVEKVLKILFDTNTNSYLKLLEILDKNSDEYLLTQEVLNKKLKELKERFDSLSYLFKEE